MRLKTAPAKVKRFTRRRSGRAFEDEEVGGKMRRIAVKVEYDGTDFVGWQLQAVGRSVQGVMEEAVRKATGAADRVVVQGAGRTDAGVHAEGQVAHFDTECDLEPDVIVRALNYWLPRDVSVLAARQVAADFNARFSATLKLYRYRVLCCRERRPLTQRYCLREPCPLDLSAMQECASLVLGAHDFASFTTEKQETQDTVRTVRCSEWTRAGDEPATAGELHYHVAANGFLYNMVRALVGTMLQAGRGKLTPDEFRQILHAHDRRAAGPTAPPQGLALVDVRFGESCDLFGPQPKL